MGDNRSGYLKKNEKDFILKCDELLKGSERELVYYLHYLQENNKSRKYISNIDYENIKNIRNQIKNALIKTNDEEMIFDMQSDYEEFASDESKFIFLKNDSRSCFLLLIEFLIENRDLRRKVEDEDYININSNSIYYSIISFFDKTRRSIEYYKKIDFLRGVVNERAPKSEQSLYYSWLLKINSEDELIYCFNYLEESSIIKRTEIINRKDIVFLIRLSEKYSLDKKNILIALFDYLYQSSDAGAFAAENLKMKMASALSSWKNRKNKEGYVDVHFDIKNENISKLEELKKRFNLMSKKEVVNALIEREYDKKE
ncbi:hypothetical protein ACS5F0_001509 [Providencia rettgeri]